MKCATSTFRDSTAMNKSSVTPYYEDDSCMIYHGDCRELMPGMLADVMVTDPPYGIGLASSRAGRFGAMAVANDESVSCRDEVLSMWDGPALVFGSWKVPKPAATRMVLIWDKGGHAGMGDLSLPWKPNTEEIYVIGGGFKGVRDTSVLSFWIHPTTNTVDRWHPTCKPIELMRALVHKCLPLATLIDPFMGSGTTLRAAKDLGRKAIGIEIEERYCEIAARRLAQEVLPL